MAHGSLDAAIPPPQYIRGLELGRGVFGTVYKATRLSDGVEVAIKEIPLTGIPKGEHAALLREASLLARLSHCSIVQYIDSFLISRDRREVLCIVTELCSSGDLAQTLEGRRPKPSYVKRLCRALLKGLVYLHRNGVIHRDIKVSE